MLLEEVRILVIDDVQAIRVQIQELLMSAGFRNILMIESSQKAMPLLKSGSFHLILSDWHMPAPDGLELLRLVRTDPDTTNIPFILVTAESSREQVIEAIAAGVDDYLVKPFTLDQITTKVKATLIKKKVLS